MAPFRSIRPTVFICLLAPGLLFSSSILAQAILPGPELNGGWFNTETPGQGLLIDINPELNLLFAGWFTYRDTLPATPDPENHRWFTFQGSLQGSNNEFTIFLNRDGVFNDPRATASEPAGTARLIFTGCNAAVLTFELDGAATETITLARLLPVEEDNCRRLKNPDWQAFSIDAVKQQHDAVDRQYIPFLDTSSLDAGMYYLAAGVADQQGPHGEDEVYIIINGKAQLQAGGQTFNARPGKIFFVKANVGHRFINIENDLEVLVLFSAAASAATDPDVLRFDLPDIQGDQPASVNDWQRFLDVASMHLGSYSLPLVAGGDSALVHEVDEFNLVTEGAATFHIGDETLRVEPGSMVWVKEGNPHFFDELSKDFKVLILFHQKPGVNTP